MKLYHKIVLISCLLCSACTNSSIQLPDEADWVYVNKEMFDRALGGYRGEYQIKIEGSDIHIKSIVRHSVTLRRYKQGLWPAYVQL